MYSISNVSTFDDTLPDCRDTLPLPTDVECEFLDKAGDDVNALIDYALVWNPNTGRYQFMIYGPDDIGPKRSALAVPVYEGGAFVDLLLIGDDCSFETACCRASWLGRDNIGGPVVRLHAHPLDWLEAGCTGVCHIEPITRAAFEELRGAESIECNDIYTALCAWDWGFDSDNEELARFSIDDTPESVRSYFEDEVIRHGMRAAVELGAQR
jgi:hypothetical protein